MSKTIIAIDNGVSGSIAIFPSKKYMHKESISFHKTPIKIEQNYTKAKASITRLNGAEFRNIIKGYSPEDCLVLLERPLVNPRMFKTTLSAMRCLEAQLIIIEDLLYPYRYVDSKEWQRNMLPKGKKDREELKKLSLDIGCRLFPQFKDKIIKQKDADSLLMGEYFRRIEL